MGASFSESQLTCTKHPAPQRTPRCFPSRARRCISRTSGISISSLENAGVSEVKKAFAAQSCKMQQQRNKKESMEKKNNTPRS